MTSLFQRCALVAAFSLLPALAEASHFRYGHTTWRHVSGNTVEFTSIQAWRCNAVHALDIVPGDGSPAIHGTATTILRSQDCAGECYEVVRYTVRHTYPSAGPWTARLSSCCRIASLLHGSNDPMTLDTVVDLRLGNKGSPVSSIPPILQFPLTGGTFILPIADPDGDTVTCRFATSAESGISSGTFPAGLSLVGCNLNFVPSGANNGDKWAIQIILEEHRPGGINNVALDFIIETCDRMGNRPPECMCNHTKNLVACENELLSFWFCAIDPESAPLSISAMGLPPGATLAPTSGPSPHCTELRWMPTSAHRGSVHAITFIITDPSGAQGYCSIVIRVAEPIRIEESDRDCAQSGPTPASPSPALRNHIVTNSSPGRVLNFDECPGVGSVPANSWFGHTFNFDVPHKIERAYLTICLKATPGFGGGLAYNDTVSLEFLGTGSAWSRYIGTSGGQSPGLDPSPWTAGRCRCFRLNLSSLPGSGLNLIPSLLDGELDVMVSDDTCVDYLRLEIYPCKPWGAIALQHSPAILQLQFNDPATTGVAVANTANSRTVADTVSASDPAWRAGGRHGGGFGRGSVATAWPLELDGSNTMMWWMRERPNSPPSSTLAIFSSDQVGQQGLACVLDPALGPGPVLAGSAVLRPFAATQPVAGSPGQWKHVALVIDDTRGEASWYIDGALDPSRVSFPPGSYRESSGEMIIGGDASGSSLLSDSFDLDDFRMYRYALSEEQIRAAMIAETPAASLYGEGCGGELEPVIGTAGVPLIGNTSFGIEGITERPGTRSLLFLSLGPQSPGLPLPSLGSGCQLHVSPFPMYSFPVLHPNLCWVFPIPIQRDIGALSANIYAQVVTLDPATLGFGMSRGLHLNVQS